MPSTTVTTDTMLDRLVEVAVRRLKANPLGSYAENGPEASEPTAWNAIALALHEKSAEAKRATQWLAKTQRRDGSVGVTAEDHDPAWPTSLAILAWEMVDSDAFASSIQKGASWALNQQPWTVDELPLLEHDPSIEGWSWAPNTHSWLEPTAFFVMALRRVGFADHPRTAHGIDMLVDRLLPSGGVNYGNTIVLGQELLQHLQPTGIAAWTLADLAIDDPRWHPTLEYLLQGVKEPTGVTSVCYATIGLAANGIRIASLKAILVDVAQRSLI